jgi:uncharacterized protein with von Willebrand factor type A (vWA) domain
MADPRALVRLVDELLWALRREGFDLSTSQAIDASRAVLAVGLEHRTRLRDAVGAVVVPRAAAWSRFEEAFDRFFAQGEDASEGNDLSSRLRGLGFDTHELGRLHAHMERLRSAGESGFAQLDSLLERGAELDRRLAAAGFWRTADDPSGLQLGFRTHRLLGDLGIAGARRALAALRALLSKELGPRGRTLADGLERELEHTAELVQGQVRRAYEARRAERTKEAARLATTPFVSLTDAQVDEVRRAVRRFAARLRGGAKVRARRAKRGRIDAHRTLRRALRTAGAPFVLARKERRRQKPKLVLLCDVSDSVRTAACFLLEFAYASQELFAGTRTFVFVSDIGEATETFARESVRAAVARAWRGDIVSPAQNSNYGRALRQFEAHHLGELDRRTTVVVLGDGRSNYLDGAPEVLDKIRTRSRALLWLCPEPRALWSTGDSLMATYAPRCTAVFEVRCAADLEQAARALATRK